MSYVYGVRGMGKLTPLVLSLRDELYAQSYGTIDWNAARNRCAATDLYYPHPWIQDVLWWSLYKAEGLLLGSRLRKKALQEVMRHVHYEVNMMPRHAILQVLAMASLLCDVDLMCQPQLWSCTTPKPDHNAVANSFICACLWWLLVILLGCSRRLTL